MKDTMTRSLTRLQTTFNGFSVGQKLVAVIGTAALLMGGFMVFKWAATPSYSPLFSNMAAEDAAAVIEELNASGVPYEISNNGATVLVPKEQVYETRIALSGEGLPAASSSGGYSILDEQSLSTSQFQEQTSFKRAMEGELATTIEAIDGVNTAVVHLALPPKQVFAKEQDPATASVLVSTSRGDSFAPEQVQAVVHLVASSIDGLSPEKVTVADSTGRVLSADNATSGTGAGTRAQAVEDYQNDMSTKIQRTLDTVIGPGNSTVVVTANLDFDKSVSTITSYESDPEAKPLSRSRQSETYNGAGGPAGAGGVVGPEGQMENQGGAGGDSNYRKESTTEDNAVDTVVETREAAPGGVESLHIGVALDANAPVKVATGDMRNLIAASIGENLERGDTIEVSSLPFDRSAQEAANKELEAAGAADAKAARNEMLRNVGLGALIALMLLLAWLKGRRRAKARAQATTYVVEQLRADQANRVPLPVEPNAALMALESAEQTEAQDLRDELSALVERQPEDVAQLLRGWLVDRP